MSTRKPTYQQLEERLATAEPIVEALKRHEVDAVVGAGKITLLLLQKVENQLVGSEAEFRAMFALPGIGMLQADAPAFRFTGVNQKFCAIMGYSCEELLTQTYLGLTHPDDRHRDMKTLAKVLRATADSWTIEKHCLRKDGSIVCVEVNGTVLRDANGRAVRILAMITDITAGKRAAQAHRDAATVLKKQVQELTSVLAQVQGGPARLKAAVQNGMPTVRAKLAHKPRRPRR